MPFEASLLQLIVGEPLLHALADEVLRCRRYPTKDLPQTDQRRYEVRVETGLRMVD